MKRVFIAIRLPQQVKDAVEGALDEVRDTLERSGRILPAEQWHITLLFLGYQEESAVRNIERAVERTAQRFGPCFIRLNQLVYAPSENPRMVWLADKAQSDAGLNSLVNALTSALQEEGVSFDIEHRLFVSHATLVRFQSVSDRSVRLPQVEVEFTAAQIDIMESELTRTGAMYSTINSFPLKRKVE